jgi:hypothetical protein
MAFNCEVVLAEGQEQYRAAKEAAAAISLAQLNLAARAAGFYEWLISANRWNLKHTQDDVAEALSMPYPSPVTQALRAELGFPSGVVTVGDSEWSLSVGDKDPAQPYDTGVRLVAVRRPSDSNEYTLSVPLDIAIPSYNLRETINRPDRVKVQIGERQLPGYHGFTGSDAQRLLFVTSRFLTLLSSGEAAGLIAPSEDTRPRRLLGRVGQALKALDPAQR